MCTFRVAFVGLILLAFPEGLCYGFFVDGRKDCLWMKAVMYQLRKADLLLWIIDAESYCAKLIKCFGLVWIVDAESYYGMLIYCFGLWMRKATVECLRVALLIANTC